MSAAILLGPAGAVADPPAVSQPPDISVEATGPSTAVSIDVSSYVSDDNGTPSVDCSPTSFPVGTTAVSCVATDPTTQETASLGFNVTVSDTTPPTLGLSSLTAEATGPSGADVSYSATASDLVDGSVSPNCSPGPGSTFPFGSTTVNCTATDSHGNSASGSFTVNVVDTTAPAIAVPGGMTIEATSPSGVGAVSYSASATDIVDGPVPVSCAPASGSAFPLGSTTVTCTASDSHGNNGSASFTVNVVDTTPPAITAPAGITVEATGSSGVGAVTYSASATDNLDGAVPVSCAPASGSAFPLGSTTVTCTASDSHGNNGSASFTVNVVDTTPPTLTVPASIAAHASDPSGASLTYPATAVDVVDGSVTPSCSPASGSTFPIGKTTVDCTATDTHGNAAHASFTVTILAPSQQSPPAAPTITIGGPFSAVAGGPPGAAVNYAATAGDDGGTVPVACNPAPGSVFPVGKTTVTCKATGHFGATAVKTFTVTVVDRTPPPAVTGVTTRPIDGGFVLRWQNPSSSDFDHVEIFRTRLPSGSPILLQSGSATTYTDRHATNPALYLYTVYTVDGSGNRNGVAITLHPTTIALVRPADGAHLSGPPTLFWVPQGASYYNLQLYRGGTKVLSVWPSRNHYALPHEWRFNGRVERLLPGTYRWFVWPGVGAAAKRAFGNLLGSSTFVVAP